MRKIHIKRPKKKEKMMIKGPKMKKNWGKEEKGNKILEKNSKKSLKNWRKKGNKNKE